MQQVNVSAQPCHIRKKFFQSILSNEWLKNLILLTIFKELLDGLNSITISNEFNDNNIGTFKIYKYAEVNNNIEFCLHSGLERIIC